MRKSKLNFSGHNIYVGIDVHKKSWSVHIVSDQLNHGGFSQPPEPKKLVDYLTKNFPGATYHCVYEAGFCGFWILYALKELGANCIVVNPADVPTTHKEKVQKRDKVDCRKLARALRQEMLDPIYVPSKELLEHRLLVRSRYKFIRNRTRCKNRIKSILNFHGIKIPEELDNGVWTIKLKTWLRSIPELGEQAHLALNNYVDQLEELERLTKKMKNQIKSLAKTPTYKKNVALLTSIPGIGPIIAMTILTELGDIERFKTLDQLNSYIGFIPNVYASGDSEKTGYITRRGNQTLKSQLIQSAWSAVQKDPALMLRYSELKKKMKPGKAIVKIVRKLINRIRYVLKNQQVYQLGIVE